jgi:hypothetical protein
VDDVEANVRMIYCDRCGGEVRAVSVDWFSLEPVLCSTCHSTDQGHLHG